MNTFALQYKIIYRKFMTVQIKMQHVLREYYQGLTQYYLMITLTLLSWFP